MFWGIALFFLLVGVIMWYGKRGKEGDGKVGPSATFYLIVPIVIVALVAVFTIQNLMGPGVR